MYPDSKHIHFRIDNMCNLFSIIDKYGLDEMQKAVFKNLFMFFEPVINSVFYRVMNMSDGKYTLIIRKDVEHYDVKFTINPCYKGNE